MSFSFLPRLYKRLVSVNLFSKVPFMRFLTFVLLLMSANFSFGQGLTLSGLTKNVDVPLNKYLVVHYHPDGLEEKLTKEHYDLFGTLILATKDSITLLLDRWESETFVVDAYNKTSVAEFQALEKQTIAKENILSLRVYNSLKGRKNKRFLNTTGGVFIFTGLITLANIAVIGGKARTDLLISGSVQIGVGAFLLALAKKKEYRLKSENELPEWRLD